MLLIDEVDRADDDFEAFLLELLGEAAVTIPELGTVRATHPPIIVLTSNRTRDLHDAVKRRCLYQWIDYPSPEREVEIIRRRVRGAAETLAVQVADRGRADARLRRPEAARDRRGDRLAGGARACSASSAWTRHAIGRTLGSVLKYAEDQDVRPRGRAGAAGRGAAMSDFQIETVHLDLPALAGAFGRRLHEAGVPVTAERSARFARALRVGAIRRASRRLYWTARAVFVSDPTQVRAFNAVFADVFGAAEPEHAEPRAGRGAGRHAGRRAADSPSLPATRRRHRARQRARRRPARPRDRSGNR